MDAKIALMPEGEWVLDAIAKTESDVAFLKELGNCLGIFIERSEKYGNAWTELGADANLVTMLRKANRIHEQVYVRGQHQDLDDVYDLINYGLMYLAQANLEEWRK